MEKTKTSAARYNKAMYQWLGDALKKDPEADITTLLSPKYSKRLKSFKKNAPPPPDSLDAGPPVHRHDLRLELSATDPCTILYGLSNELKSLTQNHISLADALLNLLAQGDVIVKKDCTTSMVLRIHQTIAVKITHAESVTEYCGLWYLEQNLLNFPAPKPHGLVQFGKFQLLFTTFIPGLDLKSAWSQFDSGQKENISNQLSTLLSDLRSLAIPDGTPLGGIRGMGCKDIRRDIRTNIEPVWNEEQFRHFIFGGSRAASSSYTAILRDLLPLSSEKCVFTHGDLRPANIIVVMRSDQTWKISGILDWAASGFYPNYWESLKMTKTLTLRDTLDWYRYLPASVSVRQYPVQWLVDRLWDSVMSNN